MQHPPGFNFCETAEVVSVRRGQGLPLCQTKPVNSSLQQKTDPLPPKAETISTAGSASVVTFKKD